MERKIKLQMAGEYTLSEIRQAVVNGLSYEYLVEKMSSLIGEHKDVDLSDICNGIDMLLSNSNTLAYKIRNLVIAVLYIGICLEYIIRMGCVHIAHFANCFQITVFTFYA